MKKLIQMNLPNLVWLLSKNDCSVANVMNTVDGTMEIHFWNSD